MATKKDSVKNFNIPGVNNYQKLVNNQGKRKTNLIHRFDPYEGGFNKKINQNRETESPDGRFFDDEQLAQDILNKFGTDKNFNLNKKDKNFHQLNPEIKKVRLAQLSSHDLISEVLDKLINEIVVFVQGEKYPMKPIIDRNRLENLDIKEEVVEEMEEYLNDEFAKIYRGLGFNNVSGRSSIINKLYKFLVEGKLSYEIVFDNIERPKKILGFVENDPLTLKPFYHNGLKYWVKENKNISNKREKKIILYDSQVIYIDWADLKYNNLSSYLEHLIKSFNDLRIMDETRIIWGINNSLFRTLFVVPVKNKGKVSAAKTLIQERERFRDDIKYDGSSGELEVNGQPGLQMQKEYWMSEGDSGRPDIQTLGGDGPDLNDVNVNEYFARRFYRSARMPMSRFSSDSGETWNIDPTSQLREEIYFSRFIQNLREVFSIIIKKPLIQKMLIKYPEIKDDQEIIDSISILWSSYNVFEELMQQEIMLKKIQFIEDMRNSLQERTPDGDEIMFWSMEYLVRKYLPEVTDEDLKLNKKLKRRERKEIFRYMKNTAEIESEIEKEFGIAPDDDQFGQGGKGGEDEFGDSVGNGKSDKGDDKKNELTWFDTDPGSDYDNWKDKHLLDKYFNKKDEDIKEKKND